MTASLYLHIPFCAGACDYCDFYSIPVREDDPRLAAYVDRLLEDARGLFRRFGLDRVPSLYLGGGTPSLLGAAGTGRLLGGLRALLPSWPGEVTLEANPESAGEDFLYACRDAGVNRISLGLQSFHEPSRARVHRVGEGALLPQRLALAAEIFPGAFSVDLMTGLPAQTEAVLRGDIEKALAFHPAHVSLYALTMDHETSGPAGDFLAHLPPADEADRLWILGRDLLEAAGYAQYEVSNFALPGKRSRHNIRYWRMENWLGIGPAASGTLIDDDAGRGRRYRTPPDLAAYLRAPPPPAAMPPSAVGMPPSAAEITEDLDRLTLIQETFLMGFRYVEGPDRELFKRRFRRDLETLIPRTLERWRNRGLLAADRLALNREGLLFLNAFLAEAFGELEAGAGDYA